jgi:dTDP-4-amino-4,6-dideoxygalactose transaminase
MDPDGPHRPVIDFRPSYLLYVDEAIESVAAVLRSGRVLQGEVVGQCEERIATMAGKRSAVLFSSATSAIEATMAYDRRDVDTATVNFVSVPYLARKLGRDLRLHARSRPLSGPLTGFERAPGRRVWHAALAGQASADYVASVDPDDIEDASQCFLTSTPRGMVGTFGHAGIYSFTFNKFATSGEGGVVVTDDPDLVTHLCRYRNFGRSDSRAKAAAPVDHPGFNHRMSEVNAALLLVQLEHAKETSRLLGDRHDLYRAELARVGIPLRTDDYDNHTRAVVEVPDVAAVRRLLADRFRIATPTPIMDYSMTDAAGFNGPAEPGWNRLLCLPFWHGLTAEDIENVAKSLAAVLCAQ